jgi:hypothetical protein
VRRLFRNHVWNQHTVFVVVVVKGKGEEIEFVLYQNRAIRGAEVKLRAFLTRLLDELCDQLHTVATSLPLVSMG